MFTMLGVNIEFSHVHTHTHTHTCTHENTETPTNGHKASTKKLTQTQKKKKRKYISNSCFLVWVLGDGEWRFCWGKNGWNKKKISLLYFLKKQDVVSRLKVVFHCTGIERKKDLINYSRLGVQDLDGVHFFSWNYIVPLKTVDLSIK